MFEKNKVPGSPKLQFIFQKSLFFVSADGFLAELRSRDMLRSTLASAELQDDPPILYGVVTLAH